MGTDDMAIRDKILLATIACIEREGIESVTVRGIAKEAGVNTAAINYYFGTKDSLLELTLAHTLKELREAIDELDEAIESAGGDVRAGLRAFLSEFFGSMVRWPRLSEAQLHDALTRQDYDGQAIAESNEFLAQFTDRVRPVLPQGSEAEIRLSIVQLWSGLFLLGMLPRIYEPFTGTTATDSDWREAYLDRLLEHFTER
jgi:AcrR family transcriptional regulator